jgi:hypothetical protein
MEGFSSILVAVPLLIPFGAEFHLSPFHMCMMFLLNLEIAFLAPPFGQNLFVTSFRFQKPMVSLYRIALPFLGILVVGLIMIMYIPKISTVAVEKDIAASKAKSAQFGEPPREAWLMECVQEDRNNPLPCTPEDQAKWGHGKDIGNQPEPGSSAAAPEGSGSPPGTPGADESEDDLLKEMMGEEGDAGAKAAGADGGKKEASSTGDTDDELLKEMMK